MEGRLATSCVIFLAYFAVRTAFMVLSGFDSFELHADTGRYDMQSDKILRGQYNLMEKLWITAPGYPYLQAAFKLMFGSAWIPALQFWQIAISSLSGVYLFKIARQVWGRWDLAWITCAIYCVFPLTLWWVHTFNQEMVFQSCLIFTVYFLLKDVDTNDRRSLVIAAFLFGLTFLTKSHILLFSPFIPIIYLLSNVKTFRRRIADSMLFAGICMVMNIPYGIYNLRVNGVYAISGTGHGGTFLTGRNDDAYLSVVAPPPAGSSEAERLRNMDYQIFDELSPRMAGLTPSQVQDLYFEEGMRWIRENPQKAVTLAGYNLYHFLRPGVNSDWYPWKQWLAALIVSAPIYALAYLGMIIALRQDFRKHFWILSLVLSMVIFSVAFYQQNRFRTGTLEPFYILYASFAVVFILSRITSRVPREPVIIDG